MSILKRLFGKAPRSVARVDHRGVLIGTETHVGLVRTLPDLVHLAGTTTGTRGAVTRLVQRHDPDDVGYLELPGVMQREPGNPVDPNAVGVHVEGERIGYLPGYVAEHVDLSAAGAKPVQVQIFTQLLETGLRVEAWTWIGAGKPVWRWSADDRPPMSPRSKSTAKQQQTDRMVKEALAGGGPRAMEFRAGMVDGVHYLQTVEPIKQLKREGKWEEALALCYKAIEGAEAAARADQTAPAPFYTEQAAIVHRK
ncbi:MAG: hypothetical protein EOO27_38440, partial [Comamonadaceae bacterium]